mgnify:CR=1 FL=1
MRLRHFLVMTAIFSTSLTSFSQECVIGEVRMFAGNFAPRNWAFCDGQLMAINSNQSLYSVLGTTYGGDGITTFGLPELRGRTPVHPGFGPGLPQVRLGEKGGATSFTLSNNNLPSHSHTAHINVSETEGDQYHTSNSFLADSSRVEHKQFTNVVPSGEKIIQGVHVNSTGSGQSYSKRSPFQGIHYIICLTGTFPSRN